MNTYVISLKRVKERAAYIESHVRKLGLKYEIISAVDGNKLAQQDLENHCDMNEVNNLRWWLNNGAIGCALSHLEAYKKFVNSNEKAAFIVEDDVMLPDNISETIEEIEGSLTSNEVILLYYTSFKPCKLSSVGLEKLSQGSLVYPMDIRQTITAAAYIISRQAAINLIKSIEPIQVTADCWYHYYEKGDLDSVRVHYPSLIKTKNFKSSIDYFPENSWKSKVSKIVNQYKIPFAYQLFAHLRRKRLNSMLGHFSLIDEESVIYANQKNLS